MRRVTACVDDVMTPPHRTRRRHAPPQRRVPRPRRRLRREQAGHGLAGAGLVKGRLGRKVDGIPVNPGAANSDIWRHIWAPFQPAFRVLRGAGLPDDGPGLRVVRRRGALPLERDGDGACRFIWRPTGFRAAASERPSSTSATSWVRARRSHARASREREAGASGVYRLRGAGGSGILSADKTGFGSCQRRLDRAASHP